MFTLLNNQFNTIVKKSVKNQYGDNVHLLESDFEFSCIEDVILFLREEEVYSGDFEYPCDYQFNGFYICGSDLIDYCKAYSV